MISIPTNNELVIEPVHDSSLGIVPKRVICLPVDNTKHCSSTLDWALDTIVRSDDQVVLLHVRPTGRASSMYGLRHDHLVAQQSEEYQIQRDQQFKKQAHQLLTGYFNRVIKKQFHCRAITLVGDPREQLELKIQKLNPDLVIMASKSSSTFSDVFMGSVSKHVLHSCKTPVLIRPVIQ
jgi:nucleotide-binding universal stress UspA family protein